MQVVIAIDDSRSMRENGCGTFAMEAVTLVARALGRLEVGELAVVRFGGAANTAALHPLDKPFTDADGPRVLSHLRFDQVGRRHRLARSPPHSARTQSQLVRLCTSQLVDFASEMLIVL